MAEPSCASRSAAGAAGRAPTRSSRAIVAARAWRSRVLLGQVRPHVVESARSAHELASTTTGSAPPSLQRQSASTIWLAMKRVRPPGSPSSSRAVAQQRPPTSSGIQTGSPARAETATSASGRLSARAPAPARAEDPVDAGGEVDGLGARPRGQRQPRGRRRAACSPATRARARRSTRPRAARVAAAHRRFPQRVARPCAARARGALDRAPALGEPQRGALRGGAVLALRGSSFTSLPVSIPTGHASRQVPSAAQVSIAVVLVLARAAPAGPASRAAGAPSRGAARSAGAASWSGRGSGRPARRTRTRRRSCRPPRSRASS